MRGLKSLIVAIATLAAGATAVPAAAQGGGARAIIVVASFSILGDLVHTIGGDKIAVRTLVGPNGDAHVYQPTPADAKALAAAQVLVVNGLGFEGWIGRLAQASGFKGLTITASDGIAPLTMEDDEADASAKSGDQKAKPKLTADPHAFQSLVNAQIYVDNIARGLAAADPANAAYYAGRAQTYKQQMAALDADVRSRIAGLPEAKRKIITTHDAFRYFGREYGVTFLAAEGVTTESDPSARDIARLIAQVRKENIRALFIENMSDPRLIQQIARDAGATVGGELYADALSPPGGPADTYLKLFRYNVDAMVAAMAKN